MFGAEYQICLLRRDEQGTRVARHISAFKTIYANMRLMVKQAPEKSKLPTPHVHYAIAPADGSHAVTQLLTDAMALKADMSR
jgi:hypothetical protein